MLSLLSASPLPPFRSLPLACLSPNPPAPPKTEAQLRQIFPWLRTVRTPVQKQLPNQSGNGPILASASVVGTAFVATGFQPRAKPATVSQTFFNRLFNRLFNRFSTDFQPFGQPIINRALKLVALSGHNALETPVCFTKKRGGKDGSAEGRDGSEQHFWKSRRVRKRVALSAGRGQRSAMLRQVSM